MKHLNKKYFQTLTILLSLLVSFYSGFSFADVENINTDSFALASNIDSSSIDNDSYIQFSEYLPLKVGNKWVMHSDNWGMDLTYEVTQSEEGVYLLNLNNPWITWKTYLFPLKNKIYITRLDIASEEVPLGGYSLYFDFSSPKGTIKKLSMGNLQIIDTNKTVTVNGKAYANCIQLELTSSDGFKQGWTFAPKVGFIEFIFSGEKFSLNESASTINSSPSEGDKIKWTEAIDKGDRLLSIDINPAQDNDYVSAFDKAAQVGTQVVGLHFGWDSIETSPNQYEAEVLNAANFFYPQQGTRVTLNISPIHNVMNNMPNDLKGLPFDSPIVINRFKKLLEYVSSKMTAVDIESLVIGSEIDAYLKDDQQQWQEYEYFYKTVAEYARIIFPNTNISTEFTFVQGYLGVAKPFIKSISEYSDVIGISYYPRDIEGFVLNPEIVRLNFKTIVDAFPNKQIYFYQLGYPSSSVIYSSEAIQASFIEHVFMAWDEYQGQIKLIDFTFLHDLNADQIDSAEESFEQSNVNFTEFLKSLGLRALSGNGVDKLSFSTMRNEVSLRNWR